MKSRLFALAFLIVAHSGPAAAQAPAALAPLAPGVWLAHDPAGNVVVAIGPDGAVVIGPQTRAAQPALRQAIQRLSRGPVRFVVVTASPTIDASRDAGWGAAGATVVAEEHAAARMAAEGGEPGLAPPSLGFSEVVQIHAANDDIHVVRQKPGYSIADVAVHLERARVLYLGNAFIADGYPTVDEAHGGTFTGLVETAEKFMSFPPSTKIVPGRGGLSTPADVREYHAMLVGLRDRVRTLRRGGKSLAAIIAAHPSAAWDARWGHTAGAVDELVTAAYHDLSPASHR